MASQFSIPSSSINDDQPISRTYQYRKVMKPMLERKRRARINRCLDEMKELMSSTLAAQGEHISKLEKADVLELTVRHLQKLKQAQMNTATNGNDKYCAGFSQCAVEVRNFLVAVPGIDINVGRRLLTHLGRCAQRMQVDHGTVPAAASSFTTPPSSPQMAPLFLQFQKAASAPSSPVDISSSFSPAYSETDALEMMKFSQKSDSVTVGDCKDVWRPW